MFLSLLSTLAWPSCHCPHPRAIHQTAEIREGCEPHRAVERDSGQPGNATYSSSAESADFRRGINRDRGRESPLRCDWLLMTLAFVCCAVKIIKTPNDDWDLPPIGLSTGARISKLS
jgi:hypothetical protein